MVTVEYKGLMQAHCVSERSSPYSGRLWIFFASKVDAWVKPGKAARVQVQPAASAILQRNAKPQFVSAAKDKLAGLNAVRKDLANGSMSSIQSGDWKCPTRTPSLYLVKGENL